LFRKKLAGHLVGEIRIETVVLTVRDTREPGEDVPTLRCDFATITDDGYRMIVVPYYLLEKIEGLEQAVAVAELVRAGDFKLAEDDG